MCVKFCCAECLYSGTPFQQICFLISRVPCPFDRFINMKHRLRTHSSLVWICDVPIQVDSDNRSIFLSRDWIAAAV